MKKKGKVKFADHANGYGYIISEDAADPTETVFFEIGDLSAAIDALVPGTEVTFDVDQRDRTPQAKNVTTA